MAICFLRRNNPSTGLELATHWLAANKLISSELAGVGIEGNQLVAMKLGESLSPSLFTFRSRLSAIRPDYYYDSTTARKPDVSAGIVFQHDARDSLVIDQYSKSPHIHGHSPVRTAIYKR